MTNALVITDSTAIRMAVIAERTQNLLVAGAKAMMIENLKSKLHSGVAHFIFQKKNGEYNWRRCIMFWNFKENFINFVLIILIHGNFRVYI